MGIKKWPTERILGLARPKHYTPKYFPMKIERIVDLVHYGPDGNQIPPPEPNLRIPPRVLMAAVPYERILQATFDQFADKLPQRHYYAILKYLEKSKTTMYQKLVKRPICTGPVVEQPPPKHMEEEDWYIHRQRILELSKPRKDWDKLYESMQVKRAQKPLDELMPRILILSDLQQWKKDLMKEVDKDITKVQSKALLYEPSARVEEISKPKKVEDCSLEGTLRTTIIEKFEKKLENELLRRRAAARVNFKRV